MKSERDWAKLWTAGPPVRLSLQSCPLGPALKQSSEMQQGEEAWGPIYLISSRVRTSTGAGFWARNKPSYWDSKKKKRPEITNFTWTFSGVSESLGTEYFQITWTLTAARTAPHHSHCPHGAANFPLYPYALFPPRVRGTQGFIPLDLKPKPIFICDDSLSISQHWGGLAHFSV